MSWAVTISTLFCISWIACGEQSCRDHGPRRIVLSADGEKGFITDGDEAINSVHCEWLIERNESTLKGASISITFTELATECSFDYVFVKDIDSSGNSRLIGALSGLQNNITLSSSSGKLYIHMFSDTNFFLRGFEASYTVSKCPNNCSGHGECVMDGNVGYKCVCQNYPKYVGSDCSFRQCAEKCWQHKEQGECVQFETGFNQLRQGCKCAEGSIGETCSLSLNGGGEDIWYRLHSHNPWEFQGRMSSAAVYLERPTKAIYLFGGFNLSAIIDDFIFFDFVQNQWKQVQLASHNGLHPPPTMGHTLTVVNHEIIMVGGTHESASAPNYVYYFNTVEKVWSRLPEKGPNVAWHTANLVGKCDIYIIGGRRSDYDYNKEVHILDWCNKRWQFNVQVIGMKTSVLQLAGHSTVYVERYRSLFIFGGFTPISIKSSERSDRLFVLNTEKSFLSEWNTGNQTEASRPPSMAYHTAVVLGNYMVVFGGTAYSHKRDRGIGADDMCYRNELYFLHLDCMLWTDKRNLSPSDKDLSIQSNPPTKRYGHVMLSLTHNVFVVIAGFDGTARGDMFAFKVSELVVPSASLATSAGSPCTKVNNQAECLGHPECAWCKNKKGMGIDSCLHRNSDPQDICGSEDNFFRSFCPGVCAALSDCQSCVLWGAAQSNQLGCQWCSHTQTCMPKEDVAKCVVSAEKESWKGFLEMNKDPSTNNIPVVDSFDSCQKVDNFRGIVLEEHQYPVNGMLPHAIYFLPSTERYDVFNLEELRLPKSVWDYVKNKRTDEDFILFNTSFNLSFQTDERDQRFQLNAETSRIKDPRLTVSNEQSYVEQTNCLGDLTMTNVPCLTQFEEAYSRVKIDFEQKLMPLNVDGHLTGFQIELKLSNGESSSFEIIPSSYVYPAVLWDQEECSAQISCFGCLRNPSCGWFSSSDHPNEARCYHKSSTSLPLTITPQHCVNCSDFTTCSSCVAPENQKTCLWWRNDVNLMKTDTPRCIEKPPSGHQVVKGNPQVPEQCYIECIERDTCAECTDADSISSHCAWCNDPPVCFPFQSYLTSFPYGSCKSWVDANSPKVQQQCASCSEHTTCQSCTKQFGCGYCYNHVNGFCVSGSFLPGSSDQNAYCQDRISRIKGPWNYTYDTCPVENCQTSGCEDPLQCLENEDVPGKFECQCGKGLVLTNDGRGCEQTCEPKCVHGVCSALANFSCICYQGYTGSDCSMDCGCNGRANCTVKGQCGPCEDGYQGSKCEKCSEMFYRDKDVCKPCECNGHGVDCDALGSCSCVNNTVGRNCDRCDESYYGDPRNGGICYKGCSSGQAVLTNTQGILYLGSKGGSEITNSKNVSSCIWKISLKKQTAMQDKQPSFTPPAMLRITRINVLCNYQFVNVYDGEPEDMHGFGSDPTSLDDSHTSRTSVSASSSGLLGSFCGRASSDQSPQRIVVAKSGVMSIVFNSKKREGEGINSLQFFEAEHIALSEPCPDDTHFTLTSGGASGGSICTCAPGWGGYLCRVPLCNAEVGRPCANEGICLSNGLCQCLSNYGGPNCTERVSSCASFILEYDDLLDDSESNDKSRSGHSMVAVGDQIFIIGGYLAKSLISPPRIMTFDTNKRTLNFFTNAGLHNNIHYSLSAAAHVVVDKMDPSTGENRKVDCVYIYGGFGSGLSISGSMQVQYLSVRSSPNSDIQDASTISDSTALSMNYVEVPSWVPKLVAHTMTAARLGPDSAHSVLLLIGGYSPDDGFNNMTILYHVQKSEFVSLSVKGDYPLGLYCHSTVYYAATKAFYVFGGLLYDTWGSQKVDLSLTLFLVTIQDYGYDDPSQWQAMWTILKPRDRRNPPRMMLHKAVIVSDYMVVLGGRTHDHDFTNKTYIYQLTCNTWLIPDVNLASEGFINQGIWEPVVGHDVVAIQNKIFIYGGFNGRYLSRVVSLEMPSDICTLLSSRDFVDVGVIAKTRCQMVSGCMFCPADNSCRRYNNVEGSERCHIPSAARQCHSTPVTMSKPVRLKPSCDQLTSCNECVSPDPIMKTASPCVWCSKCQIQRCIDRELSCDSLSANCRSQSSAMSEPLTYPSQESCPVQNVCVASTCAQCIALNQKRDSASSNSRADVKSASIDCIFTQNAKRESGYDGAKLLINVNPIFDWSCQQYYSSIVSKSDLQFGGSTTLETCPKRCSEYLDCKSCLESRGGSDSGWRDCFWATGLDRCISPTFEPVLCLDGVCDMVVRGSSDQCPKPCESFSRCIDCVSMRHCGYCSLQSSNEKIQGRGICLAGNLDGPNSEDGRCTSDSVISGLIQQRDKSQSADESAYGSPIGQLPGEFDGLSGHQWGHQVCSDENECENGHHDCDLQREVCNDCKKDECPMGYMCECLDKYKRNQTSQLCEPQCDPVCGPHGTCAAPDVCHCDFGYAGDTCSEKCDCNGNSDCDIWKPSDDPDYCTKCLFNTNSESSKCSRCNATFYGVATNERVAPSRRCKSCLSLCNNKTDICYTKGFQLDENTLTKEQFVAKVENQGPNTDNKDDLNCFGCSDNTEGDHCEKCKAGYRKKKQSSDIFQCVLCNCNFHGAKNNSCNEDDGSACHCLGHTKSPTNCDSDPNCRIHDQCSLCDDHARYSGSGKDGRQCYRKLQSESNTFFIVVNNTRFEDNNGKESEQVLMPGEAAFFFVQPKYKNVNIRITVEMTSGYVDFYLTSDKDIIRMRSSSTNPNADQISLLDPLNEKVMFSKLGPNTGVISGQEEEEEEDEEQLSFNASSLVQRRRRSLLHFVEDSLSSTSQFEGASTQPRNPVLAAQSESNKSKSKSAILSGPSGERLVSSKSVFTEEEKLFFYRVSQQTSPQHKADSLFVRLQHDNSILYATNVSGRFVVELPHEKFRFDRNQFYIAMHNVHASNIAHGIIYQQTQHNSWRVVHIISILCVGSICTVLLTMACYFLYVRCSQPQGFVNPNRHRRDMYSTAAAFGSGGSPFIPADFLFSEYNFKPQPISNIIPRTGKNAQRYFSVDSRMKNKYYPAVIGYQIFKRNEKMRVATVLFELPGKNFNLCFGSALITVCDKFPIIETIPNTPSMTISRKSATISNPAHAFTTNNTICNPTISPISHSSTMDPKKGLSKNPYLTVELPPLSGNPSPIHQNRFLTRTGVPMSSTHSLASGPSSMTTLTNRTRKPTPEATGATGSGYAAPLRAPSPKPHFPRPSKKPRSQQR